MSPPLLLSPEDEDLREGAYWAASSRGPLSGYYRDQQGSFIHVVVHSRMARNPGLLVDHINRVKADCRRSNLRLATPSQNQANIPPKAGKPTGLKGVYYHQRGSCWGAFITYQGRQRSLGRFETSLEACMAYDMEAVALWGEYAWTNLPRGVVAQIDPIELRKARRRRGSTSSYYGVSRRNRGKPWVAAIRAGGKVRALGTFHGETEAAKAVDRAIILYQLPRNRLNFPQDYPLYRAA